MNKYIGLTLLLSAGCVTMSAQATPVTLNAGEAKIFNVDLTQEPHFESNTYFIFEASISGFNEGDIFTGTLYNRLDGAGIFNGSCTTGWWPTYESNGITPFSCGSSFQNSALFADGLFSFVVKADSGQITIDSATGTVLGQDFTAVKVIPFIEAETPVPEPLTLALVGLGLAGISATRHRKPYA